MFSICRFLETSAALTAPDDIIELQEGLRRQVPARLAEPALGDPADVELLILCLAEEAVHLPL
jgi:hypothetical protein